MTIAEYLRSISFEDIEEILWEVYGMGDNFTPFIKMTYDRICHQTGTSEHSYLIVQIVNSSIDSLGMNVIMPEGYKKDSLENLGKYKVISFLSLQEHLQNIRCWKKKKTRLKKS